MARAGRGETGAFGELYDRHAGLTMGVAARICGPGLAEDATQAAFLSAWNGRRTFSPDQGTVRAWLCQIARNRALDLVRSGGRSRAALSADPDAFDRQLARVPASVEGATEHVVRVEEDQALRAAVRDLPHAQREVILLAYFGGLTHSEIAAALEKPPGTVKARMRLGLLRLRRDPRVAGRARR